MDRNDNVFDRGGSNDLHWTATLYHEGKFHMFYNYGMSSSGPVPLMSGLAVSENGQDFKVKCGVVLYPDMDSWDSQLVEVHSILRAEGMWRMYYCGYDGINWRIGMAESEDLIEWKKCPMPILDIGDAQWENNLVADPHVVHFKGKYLMYYMGKGQVWQVGVATSRDGIDWDRHQMNPIMKADEEWCDGCVALSGVISHEGILLAAVHGYSKSEAKFRTKLFRSENGIKWTPLSITIEPGEWCNRGIVHPELLVLDGKLLIYYTGIRLGQPNQHRVGRVVYDLKEVGL
jgi:predicted GH43/DUF377 family glycosyl hydrolase